MLKEIKNESRNILKDFLNKHYLKKKQYAIKYLKAAQKITEEKMKTKRIKKFEGMLNKSKVFNKTFTDACTNLILIFHFKFKADSVDSAIAEQYIQYQQDPKADQPGISTLVFEEYSNWKNLISKGDNEKLNLVVKSIADKVEKYKSLEEEKQADNPQNEEDEFSSDDDHIEEEEPVSNELPTQEQVVLSENEVQQQPQILQEGDAQSSDDDNIEVEFEEIKEKEDDEAGDKQKEDKDKMEKEQLLKEKEKRRKLNCLTPEFIFEVEKQAKWEKKNQMKDTFFLAKEEADQIREEIGSSKREYIITKKGRRQVRLENLDQSKLTKRRRDYTKNKADSSRPFSGQRANSGRDRFKGPQNKPLTKGLRKPKNENHPSYQLRKDKRDLESKGKFAGKIVDL
jgi:hypothetical protein